MAEAPDEDDKTEEPSQKRLDDARAKGDVIYSTETTTWLMLAAAALSLSMAAGPAADQLGGVLMGMLAQAGSAEVSGASAHRALAQAGLLIVATGGLVFLALAAAAVLSRYAQDRPAFSASRLEPKLDRVNPLEGAKRVFGKAAAATFLKSIAKLVIVGAAVVWALWPRDAYLETGASMDLAAFWRLAQDKLVALVIACLSAFALVAGLDYFFTRQSYMKRLRMTRQELKDEYRQTEGDPQVKAKLRQIRMQRAGRRMMQKVPEASVVIANPTHYAIALKYDRETTPAPVCLAKGVDGVALKIRELAEEHGVPVVENPPLARALYATAELDQPIPRQHYEAVAKIIGIVMRMAQRRRPGRTAPNRAR